MSDPVTGQTNPYSDPESYEGLAWRYWHDPQFHALVKLYSGVDSPPPEHARAVSQVLHAIEQVGMELVPASDLPAFDTNITRAILEAAERAAFPLRSATAQYTPEDVHEMMLDTVPLFSDTEVTMQQLVEYHHAVPHGLLQDRLCTSVTFRLLFTEEDGADYRCAQCGTGIQLEEVAAWLRTQDLAGTRSPESSE